MPCDKFALADQDKVIMNGVKKLDILKLPSGQYFLDKNLITTPEVLTMLKSYTKEDLKKKDLKYPIYSIVGYNDKRTFWLGANIDDPSKLLTVIKEIEDSLKNNNLKI
jgi:hypothetical protein